MQLLDTQFSLGVGVHVTTYLVMHGCRYGLSNESQQGLIRELFPRKTPS